MNLTTESGQPQPPQNTEPSSYISGLASSAWDRAANDLVAIRGAYVEMAAALQELHDEMDDYQRINKLGGHDNHSLVRARNALAAARFCTSEVSPVPEPYRT